MIKKEAEICPKCGVRVKEAPSTTEKKSSGIAAVASFIFPGLGQIYNGQIGKGIMFVLVGFIFILLMFVVIGIPLFLILWVYSTYDAYNTAEKINKNNKV